MNHKSLKKIYGFLERDVLEKLEYSCDNCGYFECEKNTLNTGDIIRKKYKWNDINWVYCLKGKRKELENLMKILRLLEFRKWSYEECAICKKKFFKYDMKLHLESEREGHVIELSSGKEKKVYELKIFRLCKKCNNSYIHRKKSLYRGFEKF